MLKLRHSLREVYKPNITTDSEVRWQQCHLFREGQKILIMRNTAVTILVGVNMKIHENQRFMFQNTLFNFTMFQDQ